MEEDRTVEIESNSTSTTGGQQAAGSSNDDRRPLSFRCSLPGIPAQPNIKHIKYHEAKCHKW